MKNDCQLKIKLNYLNEINPKILKIVYHNTQSLNKHIDYLKNDRFMNNADLILLNENWTLKTDNYDFPNFKCIQRNDSITDSRNSMGNICFAKTKYY